MNAKELGAMNAYPVDEMEGAHGDYQMVMTGGLTKREAFAMAAMPMAWDAELRAPTGSGGNASYTGAARRAALMADALLAELAKVQP